MSKLKKKYEVFEVLEVGYDSYNMPLTELKKLKEIDMIVVIKSFNNLVDGLSYTTIQNLGLTIDKTMKKGMIVRAKDDGSEYEVDFVNNVARLAQLTLIQLFKT